MERTDHIINRTLRSCLFWTVHQYKHFYVKQLQKNTRCSCEDEQDFYTFNQQYFEQAGMLRNG
jgi:hypothetical protein